MPHLPDDVPSNRREAVRPRLLAQASAILENEGLDALQARRIAREAGCAVGTLYNVFGDIDGLIIAVNAETLQRLGEAVGDAARASGGEELGARLLSLALAYADFAKRHRHRWEAVFKHRLPVDRDTPPDYLALQSRLLAVIEAALADTLGDPERRAAAARALFGSVHGIVALAVDERLGGQVKRELDEQIAFIVDVVAAGLGAQQRTRRGA